MTTTSRISRLMATVAYEAEENFTWSTPVRLQWYPDLDRADLKAATNPVGVVLPPEAVVDPQVRDRSGANETVQIHFAVIRGQVTKQFSEGDAVVKRAEDLAQYFIHKQFTATQGGLSAACISAGLEPVISASYAKESGLWIAYTKLEFLVTG